MKPNLDSDPALDKAMRQWRVDAPLPPQFQERVWQRIADGQPPASVPFWALLRGLIETNFPRPKFAYSYVAILVLLGVISGAWTAQRQTSRMNATLGSRYVQSVDPYHQAVSDP